MIPIPLARPRRACYSDGVGRRAALAAVLITAAFIGVRALIYRSRPVTRPCAEVRGCAEFARAEAQEPGELAATLRVPALDAGAWSRRDAVMTWPRLAAGAACLAAMLLLGGARPWGWTMTLAPMGLAFAAAAAGGVVLLGVGAGTRVYSSAEVMQALWTTVFVAFWEESCYRGLLYHGLKGSFEPFEAAFISSLVFTVMHVQAQSLVAWPILFAFGLLACAAMEEGAGLPWLVLAHWAADVSVIWNRRALSPDDAWPIAAAVLMTSASILAALRLSGSARRKAGV